MVVAAYALLLAFLIGPVKHVAGQSNLEIVEKNLAEGKKFLEEGNYYAAYMDFRTAMKFAEKEAEESGHTEENMDKIFEARKLKDSTGELLEDQYNNFRVEIERLENEIAGLENNRNLLSGELEKTKTELEEERRQLKRQIRRGEAQRMILLAFQELESGAPEDALALAFLASKLAEADTLVQQPSVKRAFGDAVYQIQKQILASRPGNLITARFSPSGEQLLTAYHDGTIQHWVTTGDGFVPDTIINRRAYLLSANFSKDGQYMYAAFTGKDANLTVWPVTDGTSGPVSKEQLKIRGAAFLEDGTRLLSWSRDGHAYLWNTKDESVLRLPHEAPVQGAGFNADGDLFFTRGNNNRVIIWDGSGKRIDEIQHDRYIYSASFSPDGAHLLTASADKTARLWSADNSSSKILEGHSDFVTKALFNHNGERLLTTSTDSTARFWNLNGDSIWVLAGHDGWIVDATFSRDDKTILTRTSGQTPMLWDLQRQGSTALSGHRGKVLAASFSPDDRYVLTASEDRTAKLWDLSGNIIMNLTDFEEPVVAIDFSADGKHFLAADRQGNIVVCRLPSVVRTEMEEAGFRPSTARLSRYGIRPDWESFFDIELKKP